MMDQQQPQPLFQTDEAQQAWTLHRLYPATKRAADIRQGIWTALMQGIPSTFTALFKGALRVTTSLRVGAGTHSTLDGGDGRIIADGAAAGLITYDQTGGANWVGLTRNATQFVISTAEGLAQTASVSTGLITQASLGSITAGTNVTLNPASTPTSGTRQWTPTGHITVYFSMTAGAAIGAGSTLGTIATTGHRPTGTVPLVLRDGTAGGTLSAYVLSTGVIACDAGLTNAHIYHGVTTY